MSLDLFTPGAYARAAGGNLENGPIMAPVVRWIAWSINVDNGGGGVPAVWDLCRRRWAEAGIVDFPWHHCRSLEDVDRLLEVGAHYGSPAIGLNIEDVNNDFTAKGISLEEVAKRLEVWGEPVHMPTLPWVQNGQGWSALKRCVAALEIFPDEAEAAKHVDDCVAHAFAEGLENVTLMFKTKPPNAPEDFDLGVCHSLYTADDITASSDAWNLWLAPSPCSRLRPVTPPAPATPWYDKPYRTGAPVGPDKLPRSLFAPSAGKGTFAGDDVLAFKRAISRAGRLRPWSPQTWSRIYGEAFAKGRGTTIDTSGVLGFQLQEWPGEPAMHTGNLGDKTYQAIRRARVSDPESLHFGEPLLDAKAVALLREAAREQSQDEKVAAWRVAVADYCARAEAANASRWTYDQRRPFTGLGVAPELPHVDDCSAYVILAYFHGRTEVKLPVPDPSDFNYSGIGSTRELDDNPRVMSGNYIVGDLALYGGSGHVTICKRRGDATTSRWSSFGQEPRPEERTLHYRGDLLKVVRPPLE